MKEPDESHMIGFFHENEEYDTVRRLRELDVIYRRRKDFCTRYIPVLEMIEKDPDLVEACRAHSVYKKDDKHGSLIEYLYDCFMKDAYKKEIVVSDYSNIVKAAGMENQVAAPTEEALKSLSAAQLLGCIAWHFRRDHFAEGSLISDSIANGHMLRMLQAYLEKVNAG